MNMKSMIVGLVIAVVASTGPYFFIAAAKWCRSNELRDGGRCLLSGQEGFKHVYVGYIQWNIYLLMTNASY